MLDFNITLPASKERIVEYSTDYKNFKRFLPDQIKNIEILTENEEGTTTQETLFVTTISKKEFVQKSLHTIVDENHLKTIILEGPAKNSIINTIFEEVPSGTKVVITIDLKLSLKYKILQPFVKKFYKMIFTSILYRMNNEALKNE